MKWIGIGVVVMVVLNFIAGLTLGLFLGPQLEGVASPENIALSGGQIVLAAVLCRDASRDAVVVWLECGREAVVPAEVLQVQANSFQEGVEPGHVPEASRELATKVCCG